MKSSAVKLPKNLFFDKDIFWIQQQTWSTTMERNQEKMLQYLHVVNSNRVLDFTSALKNQDPACFKCFTAATQLILFPIQWHPNCCQSGHEAQKIALNAYNCVNIFFFYNKLF